jgi:putative transposase
MMHVEGVSVALACEWAGVSRSGFYRDYEDHAPRQADNSLRDAIQRIVLENRFYGYRRVAAELRAQGWVVNHKRVLRIMRADNLLCLRKRKFVLTTNSHHPFAVYPNLLPRLRIDDINQLWVADITYIHLRETFVYLAVILDAYSRCVVGWHLSETLAAELAVKALDRALAERPVQPGLVHHSDRGVQYCSDAYVSKLEDCGFLISMSRTANPYDNAKAERFMRTLKSEEVYLQQYRDAEHAQASIGKFLEEVYNRKRLHSALGYKTPIAFEAALAKSASEAGFKPQEGVFQA